MPFELFSNLHPSLLLINLSLKVAHYRYYGLLEIMELNQVHASIHRLSTCSDRISRVYSLRTFNRIDCHLVEIVLTEA